MVHAIPVYDGGALSFVIGVDFSVASLNVLLEEATLSPSEGPVVFVMDTDGYLYATNDAGVEVVTNSQELAFAPNSSATRVSVSSTGALSGSYLVDSTFVVGSILTTVRRVDVAQLATPVRVLVSNNVTTDTASLAPQCDLIISRNVLTSAGGELEAFLVQAVRAVDFVSSLLSAGSIPSSSAAYRTLNSDAQLLVYGAVKQYVSTVGAAMYIGWPDDTFFLVNMNPSSSLGSYVSYKLSGDADRVYYAFDADTGRADVAGGVIYSKEYYPTERPWYVTAEEAGEGKYSAPFAFATGGSIGMTYAKPVYDAAGTLICIVAADFTLGALNTLLEPFNTGGEVVFGIDSITSELVAVSNGIDQVTTDEEGSNNVAVATSDITDYYVSKAAVAVQTTDLPDDEVIDLAGMQVWKRTFAQYSLNWTMVCATAAVQTTAVDASSTTTSGPLSGGMILYFLHYKCLLGVSIVLLADRSRLTMWLCLGEDSPQAGFVTTTVMGATVGGVAALFIIIVIIVYFVTAKRFLSKETLHHNARKTHAQQETSHGDSETATLTSNDTLDDWSSGNDVDVMMDGATPRKRVPKHNVDV